MTEHVAKVHREDRFWTVEVAGVGVTQARGLWEAQEMAADLIEVMTGEAVSADHVRLDVDLPGGLTAKVRLARERTAQAERLQREAARDLRQTAKRLRNNAGLTGRDAAFVLGVSEQRVSQLVNADD